MKNDIKYLRKSKNYDLTQQELAIKSGVSFMTIVNLERGKSCNLETAFKLSKFFGMPIDQIFFE